MCVWGSLQPLLPPSYRAHTLHFLRFFYGYKKGKKPEVVRYLFPFSVCQMLVRHHKPCGVTPRPGSLEPQPFLWHQFSLCQWHCCRIPGKNKLRKPNPISPWLVLLWNMLFAGNVQNFLHLTTHTTVIFLYCWGLLFFPPVSEGGLEFMEVFHWGIFASMHCHCLVLWLQEENTNV